MEDRSMKQSETQSLWDQAMLALSVLSAAARKAGDARTMYAANQAWRKLHDAGRPVESKGGRLQ
jgi:hypothetical protein